MRLDHAVKDGAQLVVLQMDTPGGLDTSMRRIVQDVLAILNSTSVFVWIVVSLVWFGLSNWAPIFTTFMITLPVVASTLVEGVASVDRRLLEMGDVYRLTGSQKFTAIVIPSTLPYLVAGMKVGFGLALIFWILGWLDQPMADTTTTGMAGYWARR